MIWKSRDFKKKKKKKKIKVHKKIPNTPSIKIA